MWSLRGCSQRAYLSREVVSRTIKASPTSLQTADIRMSVIQENKDKYNSLALQKYLASSGTQLQPEG